MPSKQTADGSFRDVAHPIDTGEREKMQSMILQKYEEME